MLIAVRKQKKPWVNKIQYSTQCKTFKLARNYRSCKFKPAAIPYIPPRLAEFTILPATLAQKAIISDYVLHF